MKKYIGIFYGPTGGSTEKVAKLIANEFGNIADFYPVKEATPTMINNYDIIIFGCSTIGSETWNGESSGSDWDNFRPELKKFRFKVNYLPFLELAIPLSTPETLWMPWVSLPKI